MNKVTEILNSRNFHFTFCQMEGKVLSKLPNIGTETMV